MVGGEKRDSGTEWRGLEDLSSKISRRENNRRIQEGFSELL